MTKALLVAALRRRAAGSQLTHLEPERRWGCECYWCVTWCEDQREAEALDTVEQLFGAEGRAFVENATGEELAAIVSAVGADRR